MDFMHRLLLTGALTLLACGPNPAAPVKVQALLPSASGTLEPTEVELQTLGNATTLQGDYINFVGTTRVSVSDGDPTQGNLLSLSDEQLYTVIVKDTGLDVRAHYVERSGVLWPADFHTWNMVSAYYNFERAYIYFNDAYPGGDASEILPLRVHYWADVRLNSVEPILDNALYLSFIKSFVLVPISEGQRVPLAMNLGVVTHETAHRVFNVRVLRDTAFPAPLTQWLQLPFNLLKSLDEGLADFHGYAATCYEESRCNPNFLAASIEDTRTTGLRNLARNDACMTEAVETQLIGALQGTWISSPDMYRVGNYFAAGLYQAGEALGQRAVLQRAVLSAYDDDNINNPGLRQLVEKSLIDPSLFTREAVIDVLAGHISDTNLRERVCGELMGRLNVTARAEDDSPLIMNCLTSGPRATCTP